MNDNERYYISNDGTPPINVYAVRCRPHTVATDLKFSEAEALAKSLNDTVLTMRREPS